MNANTPVTAAVLRENGSFIGNVILRFEELLHFSSTGSAPARIALDSEQIAALGVEDDEHIYIREVA